jgi:myo-inositol-1(or 4)-monophosphatase
MNDIELAIALADTGAEIVRSRFGTTLQRLDKGAGDFATNADIESENAMLSLLHRERPADAVLGEESGQSGAKSSLRTWLIDPLCGTLNYAARMPVAAVNVALMAEGKFIAAAVADPYLQEIYWMNGVSAYSRAIGQDSLLAPGSTSNLVDINLDPPYPNAPNFRTSMLISDSEFAGRFRPRVVSSSIALAWVATGQRAAYVTDGDARYSVHYAAGIALCEAAGCRVTNLRGNRWGDDATGLIAAADKATHDALLSMVKRYLL